MERLLVAVALLTKRDFGSVNYLFSGTRRGSKALSMYKQCLEICITTWHIYITILLKTVQDYENICSDAMRSVSTIKNWVFIVGGMIFTCGVLVIFII